MCMCASHACVCVCVRRTCVCVCVCAAMCVCVCMRYTCVCVHNVKVSSWSTCMHGLVSIDTAHCCPSKVSNAKVYLAGESYQ